MKLTQPPFRPGFLTPPGQTRRGGAGLIGLILVMLIVMIVILSGPFHQDPATQVTQAQTQLDRTGEVSCEQNRNALRTNLIAMQAANPGMTPNMAILRKVMGPAITQCPRGGVYAIGPDGTVYCTRHFPPPPAVLAKIGPVETATPTPQPLADFAATGEPTSTTPAVR
jgi:hypothetical protein